jgi:hypothetical protein
MSRRGRAILVFLGVALMLAAIEIGYTLWRGSLACVQVENLGTEPIQSLVLTCGSSSASTQILPPGGSVRLFLAGNVRGTLSIAFHQKGNAMTGFQVPGFDAPSMTSDGFKLMLRVRSNEIERYQDDLEPTTPLGALVHDVKAWFWESVTLAP